MTPAIGVLVGPDHAWGHGGWTYGAGLPCRLVLLSPGVWTAALHLGAAPFPNDNPALVSVALAFLVSWIVSVLDRSEAANRVRAAFLASMSARRPACSSTDQQSSIGRTR